MATISIADNDARIQHSIGSGGNTANSTQFTIDFPFFSLDDINVIITNSSGVDTTLTRGTGSNTFAVTGTAVDDGFSGGNITLGSVYTSSTVTIFRDIAVARTSDFATSGPFNISSLNTDLDKVYAIMQEIENKNSRALTMAESDDASEISLPNKAARKGNVLAFNATTGAAEAGPSIGSVTTVSAQSTNINTVAGISANITTVAGISSNVTTVAGISSNVTSVAGNASNINSAVSNASNINTVAGSISNVNTVAGSISNVNSVASNASNINTVAGKASLITSDFASDMALIDSTFVTKMNLVTSDFVTDMSVVTADFISDLNDLATTAIIQDLDLLATSDFISDLNAVEGIKANVTTVAGISSNVTSVAGNSSNINSAVSNASNINAAVSNASNINAAVSNATNINSVVSNASNINSVAGSITNVNNVAGAITNVNTVATNLSGVNSFAERYRVQSGVPSSNNDIGDLVFDTAANTLKVFGSSGFQNAGSSVNGTSNRFHYDISGTPTSVTGNDANGNALAYDAGFVDVYVNGVRMSPADITVTSGDTVTFANALANGDEVDIVAFGTFSLASMNASNLDSGTIPDARFPATLPAISGANLTNLDATDLTGTIASARISGSYTGITGTGALDAGSITSGFGNIDVGSSTITANGGVTVDNITIDGTEIDLSSGDLTLDVAGNIKLDADGGDVRLLDGGTQFGVLQNNSSDFVIQSSVSAKDIIFKGNDSGGSAVTAMKIDMSEGGLVKIGDDASGSVGTTGIQLQNSQDFATVYDGTNSNTFSGIQTVNTDDTSNRTATGITFVHRSSSSGVASIQSTSTASDRADLRFVTRGSDGINERMRIPNGGGLCVGNTDPGVHAVHFSSATGGNAVLKANNTSSSGNTTCYLAFMDGSGSASVNSAFFQGFNGSNNFYLLGNGTHTFTSDENAKKNIETTRDGYLEDLAKLRVVKYNWKEQEDGEDKELGLIAQEVEKVFPKLVMNDIDPQIEEKDKKKMIKTTVLPFMLLKALQEANTKITELETENKTQATQIADLISRVTALENG